MNLSDLEFGMILSRSGHENIKITAIGKSNVLAERSSDDNEVIIQVSELEKWHIKKPEPKLLGILYMEKYTGNIKCFEKKVISTYWKPVTISENGEVWGG